MLPRTTGSLWGAAAPTSGRQRSRMSSAIFAATKVCASETVSCPQRRPRRVRAGSRRSVMTRSGGMPSAMACSTSEAAAARSVLIIASSNREVLVRAFGAVGEFTRDPLLCRGNRLRSWSPRLAAALTRTGLGAPQGTWCRKQAVAPARYGVESQSRLVPRGGTPEGAWREAIPGIHSRTRVRRAVIVVIGDGVYRWDGRDGR